MARLVNEMRHIWRETPVADVGIDGQIEHLDTSGRASAALLAVQVKSGASYFDGESVNAVRFTPAPKHRTYWASLPFPVLLVLHDPRDGRTIWTDARQQLRSPGCVTVVVPSSSTFDREARDEIFATTGVSPKPLLDEDAVIREMCHRRCGVPGFALSFFDLFANGMTDIGRKLYFGMDLCMEIAEYHLAHADHPEYVSVDVGMHEHRFLDGFIRLLAEQRLAHVDFGDFLYDIEVREMTPKFIAPLTARGLRVKDRISELDTAWRGGNHPQRVIVERPIRMMLLPYDVVRVAHIRAFQAHFLDQP